MGILVVDRLFFGEIGTLDGGMQVYGGENVELGIRVKHMIILLNYIIKLYILYYIQC